MLELKEIEISEIQSISNTGDNPQVRCQRCNCIEQAKSKDILITESTWLKAATCGGWRHVTTDNATYSMVCSTCIVELYEVQHKSLS
ncbi:hypothetical protein CJF42_05110 [Pseudoalteromonas sp. NBT06-2]|uniref:hypothetical protein n=1 Tax=Pseudoalteromonas sp. NBT06-2 TaxID=2025950 RepID=UPI000BA6211A|nr:hypothetical protein [Pseudoalteromonas sp. NBT06-2]PAJ75518.1 hypothetical protein CJF42_05110 [Pseudoalteromonas sp. NBT06-2]